MTQILRPRSYQLHVSFMVLHAPKFTFVLRIETSVPNILVSLHFK